MRILFVADVFGAPGRRAVQALLPRLKAERAADVVVLNAENAAAGFGLTPDIAVELLAAGADVLTGGNHIWEQKSILDYMAQNPRLLRALNYPPGTPGPATALWQTASRISIGVTY